MFASRARGSGTSASRSPCTGWSSSSLTLLASLVTAVVYGLGGSLAIKGSFQLGTLVALTTLLVRVYGPITSLSTAQLRVMTALVSFDRVFEVLDLKPLVAEQPARSHCRRVRRAAHIEFDDVSFRYPPASEVSLASLESIALPMVERTTAPGVLHDVSFVARPDGSPPSSALRARQDHDHPPGLPAV